MRTKCIYSFGKRPLSILKTEVTELYRHKPTAIAQPQERREDIDAGYKTEQ